MHWMVYALIVVLGASGMHVFSRMAKDVIHPVSAAVIAGVVFVISAIVVFSLSQEARAHVSSINLRGISIAALMGLSIAAVNLALFYVYDTGAPLSVAVPFIRVAGIIIGVVVGVLFFAEQLTLVQVSGAALALAGVMVMAL